MSNSLILGTLRSQYGAPGGLDEALSNTVGFALLHALNDGFEAGKRCEAPLVEATGLCLKYSIPANIDAEVSETIGFALYRAFQDGYADGKSLADFRNKYAGDSEDMRRITNIMWQCTKPENLKLIDYLTGSRS